ncbi:MAG: hypothetical protein GY696_35640 [Gammaproteobacteria bacterium]|nr:hypothetical protein [Gammaproteobacteria bacterium]
MIPQLDFEKTIFTPQANEGGGGALPPSSVNPVISLSIRSHRDAKEPANCNQETSMIFHEKMDSQPAVLPPAAVDPGAEVQMPPPPLGGKGVHPPPPLPPEGGEEDKGGGE